MTVARPLPLGRGTTILAGGVGALAAALVAPSTLADDAAISFRYAARLASGAGLTYDDHERVLGISNALYTLVLAGLDALGLALPTAARALGILGVGVATVLVAELAARLAGRRSAGAAAALLLVAVPFVGLATSGLESSLAVVLGLGAFLALTTDRPVLAGVLAGLALVNKLDAALLVVTLVGVAAVIGRRAPWRLLIATVLAALPWFAFALVAYGSLLPRSLTSKLVGDATPTGYEHDPTWALHLVSPTVPLLAVAGLLGWRASTDQRARAVVGGLLAWSALQLVAASLVDLGGEYGWYLTVTIPPLVVAGSIALAEGWPRGADRRRAVAVGALVLTSVWGLWSTIDEVVHRSPDGGELLERDRIAAGRWLADHAEPDDVVDTCFGWVAYEAADLAIDDRCGLTTDRSPGPAAWTVEAPVGADPDCPTTAEPAAVFDGAQRQDPGQPRLVVCRVMLSR